MKSKMSDRGMRKITAKEGMRRMYLEWNDTSERSMRDPDHEC